MKMAKRILICLLAMALVACAFAVSVVALADGDEAQSTAKLNAATYDDILEYYECEIYGEELFDDLAAGKLAYDIAAGYLWNNNQEVYIRNEADGDNYLEMSPKANRTGYSSYISVAADGYKAFIIEVSVGASTSLNDFGFYLCETVPGSSDEINALKPVLKFSFSNSEATVSYLSGSTYVELGKVECDESSWIDVCIKYNEPTEVIIPGSGIEEDTVKYISSVEIKVADLDAVTVADVPACTAVAVGLNKGTQATSIKAKLDDLRVYEGSVTRDFANTLQSITENWIIDLKEYYDSVESVETKLEIIGVVNKLTEIHSFVTDNQTVNGIITEFTVNSIKVYADALAICNEKVAGMTKYSDKLDCVIEYAEYKSRIPDDYVSILPAEFVEQIEATVLAYDNLVAQLEETKQIALGFIDLINSVNLSATEYDELKSICIYIREQIDISAVDVTYPGADDSMETFEKLEDRRDAVLTTLYADEVESARVATYLPAKQRYLIAADGYYREILAVNLTNEKIDASRAVYLEILASNEDRESLANAYIAACLAIKDATNETELQAAVTVAEEYRATLGELKDVESLEGMTEANKLFSNAQTSLKITSLRCDQYIALVAAIGDAKNLQERFAAINAAIAVEAGTVDSYTGIPAAKSALRAAIDAYNAEVNTLNTAFDGVADVAADVSSAVNTTNSKTVIANASALIKKATEAVALPQEN